MISMTYGILPSKTEYEKAFTHVTGEANPYIPCFSFGNCKRMGTCKVNCVELWNELDIATGESECSDESLDWASCVLYVLGFEWV